MSKTTANQNSWVKLFEKHRIIENIDASGSFMITADQIKVFREPRLMTKFDHAYLLPSIFSENNISILPNTRGTYSLGRFDIFHKLEVVNEPLIDIRLDESFETLDFNNITSESTAISCAYVSKILEHFLGEEITPTISGRMGSGCFQFNITSNGNKKSLFDVDRVQIEIDAGFESAKSFSLIEAKNHFSDDFVIRQLYYPYRKWQAAIRKPVRNLFLTYSNGVFELREYSFLCLDDYNSINLINCKRYAVCNFQINVQSIQEILNCSQSEIEPPEIPFPQADSFDRVINLCELLSSEEFLTKAEITKNYGFDERQTDYYINACKYLEFAESQGQGFALTAQTKKAFQKPIALRRKFFIEQLLKRSVFRKSLELYFMQAEIPSKDQIVNIMRTTQLDRINSESTFRRRASTVTSWIDWIVAQIDE